MKIHFKCSNFVEMIVSNLSFIRFWHILYDDYKCVISLKKLQITLVHSSCPMKGLYSNSLYVD